MKRISISLSRKILLAMPLVMLRDNRNYIPQYEPVEGFYIKRFKEGQEKDWADLSFVGGSPKIKFVYPKDFKNIIDTTHTLNSPKDISVILLCYA